MDSNTTDIRKKNVLSSPKFGGSCDIDSKPFLKELGIELVERRQPIQFTSNCRYNTIPINEIKQFKKGGLLMFFLCNTLGHIEKFKTIDELKEYIEIRHAEEGGFDWVSEIRDDKGKYYGCNWSVAIEQIG